jgi:CheY-like chemotaxis protein
VDEIAAFAYSPRVYLSHTSPCEDLFMSRETNAQPSPFFADTLVGVHALAVDDTPESLELLAVVLELSGATVSRASSAAEARECYRARRPDVIVSDISMPDEDGRSLIRSVREMERLSGARPVPAIAVTGISAYLRAVSIDSGFQEHITKPVDPWRLVETIGRLVAEREPKPQHGINRD